MGKLRNVVALLGGCLMICGSIHVDATDDTSTIPLQKQGNISYVTGGVGEEELEAMHSLASKFNLKLSFATTSGAYLANVHVTVQDGKGKVFLNAVSDGPCLFAALPKGQYKVIALMDDQPIIKAANLTRKGDSRLEYRWAVPQDDVVLSPEERNAAHAVSQIRGCY